MSKKHKLIILTPPISMVSGSDVLSEKTVRELRRNDINCEMRILYPDFWARNLLYSGIPFRQRLFKHIVARLSCRKLLHQIDEGNVALILGSAIPLDQTCSFEKKLLRKGCGYIYFMQDDLFSAGHNEGMLAGAHIDIADLVVVPTPNLRDRVLGLFPDTTIEVIEEPVDIERISPKSEESLDASNQPIVVWAGNPGNLIEISGLINTLKRVYNASPFHFRIISGVKKPKLNLPIPWEWRAYSYEHEAQLFKGARIALAPMRDRPYARYKGAYKIKVYMACGLPTLASPVGYQKELIKHGETGFLVNSEVEWMEFLLLLLKDLSLARKMGKAARKFAVARYSYMALIPGWAEIFKKHFSQLRKDKT